MRRAHRTVHRVLWPVLAVLVMFAVSVALVLRPPPKAEPTEATEESEQ